MSVYLTYGTSMHAPSARQQVIISLKLRLGALKALAVYIASRSIIHRGYLHLEPQFSMKGAMGRLK